jgi:aspartate aminotransferase
MVVLRGKRDRLVDLVNNCAGLACVAPEGTFYLLVSCSGVIGKHSPDGSKIRTDRDFAAYLLEQADVAVFPGEDFGLSSVSPIRMPCSKTPGAD